jgi:hypothetical protein
MRSCALIGSGEVVDGFEFRVKSTRVDYCIFDDSMTPANQSQRGCRLQCSPTLLLGSYAQTPIILSYAEHTDGEVAVTIFNLLKCCCIFWVIYRNNRMVLRVTLIDAIASFLEEPDSHTRSFGVATKASVTENLVKGLFQGQGRAITWEKKKVRCGMPWNLERGLLPRASSLASLGPRASALRTRLYCGTFITEMLVLLCSGGCVLAMQGGRP